MLEYLQGTSVALCFTNCRSFINYSGSKSEENVQNMKELRQAFEKYENKGALLDKPYGELLDEKSIDLGVLGKFERSEVCLLDLRGEKELSKGDGKQAKVFVFGGILGDHPPRDRTKLLRGDIQKLRNLGQPQLSTDTAVLVSKLILVNGMELNKIPFVLEPEIKGLNRDGKKTVIQMEGFRYVDQGLDWRNGEENKEEKNKGEVYMHQEIRRILLEDELDVAAFM